MEIETVAVREENPKAADDDDDATVGSVIITPSVDRTADRGRTERFFLFYSKTVRFASHFRRFVVSFFSYDRQLFLLSAAVSTARASSNDRRPSARTI